MRIFLTGATGFIGAHVLEYLLAEGHCVAILLREQSVKKKESLVNNNVIVIEGDIQHSDKFSKVLINFKPDAVVHLAWWGVANTKHSSIKQLDNLQASINLMRVASSAGAKHWIALGSQAEYGLHECPITENTETCPTTTYGAIKLATAIVSKQIADSLGMRFAWLRLFSCYGPGDDGNWFIPFIIKSLHNKESPKMTSGEQFWDYLYVNDVSRAISNVLNEPGAVGVFNLGSGKPIKIKDVAEYLRDLIDPSIKLNLGAVPYKKNQVMNMHADISLLRKVTGWLPLTSLTNGLIETEKWFYERKNQF